MLPRPVLHAASLLLGAVVGVASVAVHRAHVLGLPLGLVLAVGATLVEAWVLRGSGVRRLVASYAGGWLVAFGLFVLGRSEGDFAVAGDLPGYVLIGTAFAVAALGLSVLVTRDSGSSGTPP